MLLKIFCKIAAVGDIKCFYNSEYHKGTTRTLKLMYLFKIYPKNLDFYINLGLCSILHFGNLSRLFFGRL